MPINIIYNNLSRMNTDADNNKMKCMDIYLNIFDEITYGCLICEKIINYLDINEHIKEHFNEIPYKCYICGNLFYNLTQLINHINYHQIQNNENKENINVIRNRNKFTKCRQQTTTTSNYICYYCKKEFINPHERLQHLADHLEKNQLENTTVDSVISNTCYLNACNTNSENDEFIKNPFYHADCIDDAAVFNIRNQKKKTSIQRCNKLYMCDVCGNQFTEPNFFVHHKTHQGIKFECEICDKQCTTAAGLKKHIRVHTGERPYTCKLCGRTFRFSSNYARHMHSHENIRRFECSVCLKKFVSNYHLKIHCRVHTGEKPYKCDICNTAFTDFGTLKSHKELHSDVKQYQCDDCDKCFAQRAGLYSHKKVHEKHIMPPASSVII